MPDCFRKNINYTRFINFETTVNIPQKQKDITVPKRFLMTLWFIIAVAGAGYLASILKDFKIARLVSAAIVSVLYWTGYGRLHYKVFKNMTFDRPIQSLKGFLFFLLFLIIFLIVFGKYFIPYFR